MTKSPQLTLCIVFQTLAVFLSSAHAGQALAEGARISIAEAERIALRVFPGTSVKSIEREMESGILVYEVDLNDASGAEYEVVLDAADGRIIDSRIED